MTRVVKSNLWAIFLDTTQNQSKGDDENLNRKQNN